MTDIDLEIGRIVGEASAKDTRGPAGGDPSLEAVRALIQSIGDESDPLRRGPRIDDELVPLLAGFRECTRAAVVDLVANEFKWLTRTAMLQGVKRLVREAPSGRVPGPVGQGPDPSTGEPYADFEGRLFRLVQTREGPTYLAISNFSAEIVSQVVVDSGLDRTTHVVLRGVMCDGRKLGDVRVSAADWSMLKWIGREWGAGPSISADPGSERYVRAAIQHRSGTAIPEETVYSHTGWRLGPGGWLYLSTSGGIGADGLVTTVRVEVPPSLEPYELPAPPDGDRLVQAIRASLRVLLLAPLRVTAPLYAGVWRSVLSVLPDYVLVFVGRTTSGKTEIVARGLQHLGRRFDRLRMPGHWASTVNSLEAAASAAKDTFFPIDDVVQAGGRADRDQNQKNFDRLIRSVGNHAGRDRCNPDGSLKGARPPRGLLAITAEEIPPARQSVYARMFVLEVDATDTDWDQMTAAQADGAAGLYAEAMSAFLRWLAPRLDDVVAGFGAERDRLAREIAALGPMMRRTPLNCADLLLGLRLFLDFAVEAQALAPAEREAIWEACARAVTGVAVEQGRSQAAHDPVNRFLAVLLSAFVTERAHLASTNGGPPAPSTAEAWGWRVRMTGTGQFAGEEWLSKGARVGWIDPNGEDVFLEPEAAYALVQDLGQSTGETLSLGARRLGKALYEAGKLVQTELATHRCYTVRKVVPGAAQPRVPVLWLKASAFTDPGVGSTGSNEIPCSHDATQEIASLIQGLVSPVGSMGSKGSKKEETQVWDADPARVDDTLVMKACVPSNLLPMLPTVCNSTDENANPVGAGWVATTTATHGGLSAPSGDDLDADFPALNGLLPGGEP